MQRAERLRVVFVLILSLVGTAALFLPFIGCISPWSTLVRPPFFWAPEFWLLVAPCFLTLPILAWQVRRLLTNQLSAFELRAAYVLSAAAMLSVLAFTAYVLISIVNFEAAKIDLFGLAVYSSPWILALLNSLLLWRNLANRVGREATAEAFLLGGYLPNAVFCLLGFGLDGKLQIGAYLIALVSIGYVAAIVLLSRQKRTDTPGAVEVRI